jgi:hypothetical protein
MAKQRSHGGVCEVPARSIRRRPTGRFRAVGAEPTSRGQTVRAALLRLQSDLVPAGNLRQGVGLEVILVVALSRCR